MVSSLEAKFRCVTCGNQVERNLMPWKHAVLGVIPSINRQSNCCSDPNYEDLEGFHKAKGQNTLRQGASRALPGTNSFSFPEKKNPVNGIKMSFEQMSMITMQKIVLLVSILMMAGVASAAPQDVPRASQTPGDAFYFLDRFSESLELAVAKAPVIGSSELEAKVRANHAAERLAEAQKLTENNKTDKVDKLMEDYSKQTNLSIRSAKKANNTNLTERLGNVSNNHVEVLQEVQKKVPEQAQKGIQKAIENSQKNQRELGLPEVAQDKGKPGIDSDLPARKPNKTGKPEKPQKMVNKTLDKIQERTVIHTEPTNNSVPEEPVKEVEESVENQNPEDSSIGETDETLEETVEKGSSITGKAVEKPSTPELP